MLARPNWCADRAYARKVRFTSSMVGRDAELASLQRFLTADPAAWGFLITGEHGVGKSRLVGEACGNHAGVRWVAGTHAARDLPLAAFVEWTPSPLALAEPVDMLRGTMDAFLDDAARPAGVLVVDDVDLLDPLSAILVQRLVLGRHCRVVATARSTGALPEAIGKLVEGGWVSRMMLEPLSEAHIADLLAAELGGPVETHSLRRLITAAGGGTMFLRELVESERANGGLTARDGRWHWDPTGEVPSSIIPMVLARARTAPQSTREVCDFLAHCEPLDSDLLESLTSGEAVKLAVESGLCIAQRHDRSRRVMVGLSHPLFGGALRAAQAVQYAHVLERRLGAALAEVDSAAHATTVLQRAKLCAAAADARDVDLLLAGASLAFDLYEFGLAADLAAAAERAGAGAAAVFLVAGACFRLGRIVEARERCQEVLDGAADDLTRMSAGVLMAAIEAWADGDVEAGLARIQGLMSSFSDRNLTAYVGSFEACFAFFAGQTERASRRSAEILADEATMPSARLWACAAGAITAGLDGQVGDAQRLAGLGHSTIASLRGQGFVRLPVAYGEILALGLSGNLSQAERLARELEECTQAAGGVEMSAAGSFLRGQVAWWAGDIGVAREHLGDALVDLGVFAPGAWRCHALATLACVEATSGDPDRAAESLAAIEDPRTNRYPGIEAFVEIARAWVAACTGNLTWAGRHLRDATLTARRLGQRSVEVWAWHTANRCGLPVDLDRLRGLAGAVEGEFARLALAQAIAAAHRDGRELMALADAWEQIGYRLDAADSAAQANMVLRAESGSRAAFAAALRSEELGGDKAVVTPALQATAAPAHLTRRELEVAQLAARGTSNADIARTLFVSVRTVEGHLNKVYAKLHVQGRDELPLVLGRRPPVA